VAGRLTDDRKDDRGAADRSAPRAAARARRRDAGLTQEELAGRLGLSIAYVSLIERGGRNPPFTTVVAIAHALGVSPRDICRE
jgi:transcriptional regulator with XRE-family HTH domain